MATSNTTKLHVLLVEDNLADAHLVRLHLRDAGMKYEMHHAEALYEATRILEQQPCDVALLDLSLPDSTGFRTLSTFQERHPQLPVVVLTGTNDEIVGNQAIKAGAQDFLVKGEYDARLLGRVIRYSIQRYRTQQQIKETSRRLAISEKRFVEAQQMAHFGSWEMDLVNNRMQWTDEVFRIFGHQPQSFEPSLGDYLDYAHVDDWDKVQQFFDDVMRKGQLQQFSHRIIVGARIKYVMLYAKIFHDDITEKLLMVGGLQDITERKLSEDIIAENSVNHQTNRIREQILGEMGFHVRTPLSSIINLFFLLEKTALDKQQREHIDNIKTSLDELSITISNLLNFNVLFSERLKPETYEFALPDYLQSTLKNVAIKAGQRHIHVELQAGEGLPERLIGDHHKLSLVLYNLLDNAIKYSHEGGKVCLSADVLREDKGKVVLSIAVRDYGIGMTAAKVAELYGNAQPAAATDNGQQRRPMGMAIVQKLLDIIGGRLEVRSEEHKGSTFTLVCPFEVPQHRAQLDGDSIPKAPLKILLVEDHFLNQLATKKVLTTWSDNVSVDIAENGLVGVQKYRDHGYDLVLMDLQMPVMDGFEAAKRIRELSQVPIIALTASSSSLEAEKAAQVGMDAYLPKPFKPQDLYGKIVEVMLDSSALPNAKAATEPMPKKAPPLPKSGQNSAQSGAWAE